MFCPFESKTFAFFWLNISYICIKKLKWTMLTQIKLNQFISISNIFRGSKLIINNKWILNLYEAFRKGVQRRNKIYTACPLRHFYAANFLISTDCLKSNNMKIHLINKILFHWFLLLMQLPHFLKYVIYISYIGILINGFSKSQLWDYL